MLEVLHFALILLLTLKLREMFTSNVLQLGWQLWRYSGSCVGQFYDGIGAQQLFNALLVNISATGGAIITIEAPAVSSG